jgi:RF-1 domain
MSKDRSDIHQSSLIVHRSRHVWTVLTDDQMLAQCEVDTYRASGPGGQKRNKTSSAVRLRHPPSGLLVIAEESRSQHENKAKALRRLRRALYLDLREPIALEAAAEHPDFAPARGSDGRLHLSAKEARFWPAAGVVLDVLAAVEARVGDAAEILGTSTGNLIGFLHTDPKLWQAANQLRGRAGQKPLR